MSIKAMVHYLDSPLKGNDKLCMVILADYANDSGECYPGHKRIADRLSMTEDGARKVLYRLRDAGEIEIINNAGVKTPAGLTNKYRLTGFIKGVTTVPPLGDGCDSEDTQECDSEDTLGCDDGTTDPPVDPPEDPPVPEDPPSREEYNQPAVTQAGGGPSEQNYAKAILLYENNIGLLTPILSEKIGELVEEYPITYIADAITIAVQNNVRKLSYVEAILNRWRVEGKDDSTQSKQKQQGAHTPLSPEFIASYAAEMGIDVSGGEHVV